MEVVDKSDLLQVTDITKIGLQLDPDMFPMGVPHYIDKVRVTNLHLNELNNLFYDIERERTFDNGRGSDTWNIRIKELSGIRYSVKSKVCQSVSLVKHRDGPTGSNTYKIAELGKIGDLVPKLKGSHDGLEWIYVSLKCKLYIFKYNTGTYIYHPVLFKSKLKTYHNDVPNILSAILTQYENANY